MRDENSRERDVLRAGLYELCYGNDQGGGV